MAEEQKPKILMIEDDVFMSDLLGQALDKAGFEVAAAKSGTEGVDKFKEAKPDIILLDLLLPDQNGFEALRQIRRLPHGPETKVLVLSNLAKESNGEEAKRLGAVDYMVKANFSLDEIISKIREVLDQK